LNENEFVPEPILDEEPAPPEKKMVSKKILHLLDFTLSKIEKAMIGGFQEESKPLYRPNEILGADRRCQEAFRSLNLRHSEYSRREKHVRIQIPEKNIDKNLLVELGFDIFVPHESGNPQEVISKIKVALMEDPILAHLFDIEVKEDV